MNYNEFAQLCSKQSCIRDSIDGELNRIAISDDNDERIRMCYFLMHNIVQYVLTSEKIKYYTKIVNEEIERKEKNK